MCICVIKFSFGISHSASVTKPDQVDTSVRGLNLDCIHMNRCPARDKVKGLSHHKLIIDFFTLGSQVLKLRVLRNASVAKAKFRKEVK